METKICGMCQKEKSVSEFHSNKTKPDGLQSKCKDCGREYARTHYKRNKKYYAKKRDEYRQTKRQEFYEFKKTLSCERCGFDHPAALDFHHSNDDKEYNIAAMFSEGFSLPKILEEVKKCEVLCSNCHRIEHSTNWRIV